MARKIKRHRNRDAGAQHAIDSVKRSRGAHREAHFAAGAPLCEWIQGTSVTPDRKKVKNKMACRGRVKEW